MICAGTDSQGQPNCVVDVSEPPLVRIGDETTAGIMGFWSSVCRSNWERFLDGVEGYSEYSG